MKEQQVIRAEQARPSALGPTVVAEHPGPTLVPATQPAPLHRYSQHQPQILIVCADESLSQIMASILEESDLGVESVTTMDAGCALAGSGRFEVVLSQPRLPDGTWRRLTDLATRDAGEFVVILLAKKFDTRQWLQALTDGAFDVIDVVDGLDAVMEAVWHALWVGYLSGFGPAPDGIVHREDGNQ